MMMVPPTFTTITDLTPEDEAGGWKSHDGSAISPANGSTDVQVIVAGGGSITQPAFSVPWEIVVAYREAPTAMCR